MTCLVTEGQAHVCIPFCPGLREVVLFAPHFIGETVETQQGEMTWQTNGYTAQVF